MCFKSPLGDQYREFEDLPESLNFPDRTESVAVNKLLAVTGVY